MKRLVVKRIEVWPVFKISFVVSAVIILALNIMQRIITKVSVASLSENTEVISTYVYKTNSFGSSMFSEAIGYLFYVIALSLVMTFIVILFNVFSRLTGGVGVEVEEE